MDILKKTGTVLASGAVGAVLVFGVTGHADEQVIVHPNDGAENTYLIEFQKTTVVTETDTLGSIKNQIDIIDSQIARLTVDKEVLQAKLDKAQKAVDALP